MLLGFYKYLVENSILIEYLTYENYSCFLTYANYIFFLTYANYNCFLIYANYGCFLTYANYNLFLAYANYTCFPLFRIKPVNFITPSWFAHSWQWVLDTLPLGFVERVGWLPQHWRTDREQYLIGWLPTLLYTLCTTLVAMVTYVVGIRNIYAISIVREREWWG